MTIVLNFILQYNFTTICIWNLIWVYFCVRDFSLTHYHVWLSSCINMNVIFLSLYLIVNKICICVVNTLITLAGKVLYTGPCLPECCFFPTMSAWVVVCRVVALRVFQALVYGIPWGLNISSPVALECPRKELQVWLDRSTGSWFGAVCLKE